MSLMRSVHDWDPSDSDAALPPAAIAEAQKREDEDHQEKAYMTVSQVSRSIFFFVEVSDETRRAHCDRFPSLTPFPFLPFLPGRQRETRRRYQSTSIVSPSPLLPTLSFTSLTARFLIPSPGCNVLFPSYISHILTLSNVTPITIVTPIAHNLSPSPISLTVFFHLRTSHPFTLHPFSFSRIRFASSTLHFFFTLLSSSIYHSSTSPLLVGLVFPSLSLPLSFFLSLAFCFFPSSFGSFPLPYLLFRISF